MHCGDKFPRNGLRIVDRGQGLSRGFAREAFCKINIVGQLSPPTWPRQREFFLSRLFSRMLPLLARCIIVKMSNRFLRTRGGRLVGQSVFDSRELHPFAMPDQNDSRLKIIRQNSRSDRLHYSRLANGFGNVTPICEYTFSCGKKKNIALPIETRSSVLFSHNPFNISYTLISSY